MKNLNIAQLILPSKSAEFDFTAYEGFSVTLNHLSKPELVKLREASLGTVMDKESGIPYTEVNQDKYLANYAKKAILGWKGLTGHVLAQLVLIDEDMLDDMDEEIDFSVENAISLLKNSKMFDNWVTQMLSKIDNFRK